MRVLVTGGAGFIGSHLVDALLARGDRVAVIDDLSGGRRSNLEDALQRDAELLEGDVADASFVERAVSELQPELVLHLAAQVDVRKAVADPGFDARVNVIGTINVVEAARAVPGCSVVFASTGGAIYGEGEGRALPFDESSETVPMAAYGVSKMAGEFYCGLYRRLYGLPTVALRFGNVYGPRQDPHGEAGVVAIFCGLLREGRPLGVYGDGKQTRDYVFVLDVVDALLAAGAALGDRGRALAGPYNVGTGEETSVLELVELLSSIAGREPATDVRPERTGEVQRVVIDPRAAGRDLAWEPRVALADGLARTYAALSG